MIGANRGSTQPGHEVRRGHTGRAAGRNHLEGEEVLAVGHSGTSTTAPLVDHGPADGDGTARRRRTVDRRINRVVDAGVAAWLSRAAAVVHQTCAMFKSRQPSPDEAWEGVVLGKSRGMTDGSNLYRYLTVQLSTGEKKKIRADRGLWDSVAEGDGIVKEAGSDPVRR